MYAFLGNRGLDRLFTANSKMFRLLGLNQLLEIMISNHPSKWTEDELLPVHSRWLVPLCGMGFRCRKDCFPGFFLTHSTLVSKLFFLAVQGSGALLSSNLEGALYKSP